ncbi:MAG: MerR family transcriptional regulator [Armatimonadota bacterium]
MSKKEKYNEYEVTYLISKVSEMVNMHPQTIRYYEEIGLVKPERTKGNVRIYTRYDIETLNQISTYTNMGVNLAGVEIIFKLLDQVEQMKKDIEEYRKHFAIQLKKDIEEF